MTLADDLRSAIPEAPAPKGFAPGVKYSGRTPDEIVTPPLPDLQGPEDWAEAVRDMGVPVPEGYTLHLVEALLAESHNPASWMRDPDDRGKNHTAYTAPNTVRRWRYRFKVVPVSSRSDSDIAALMREAKKSRPHRPVVRATGGTLVVNLADPQVGKVDERGGTVELLARSEAALADVVRQARTHKPAAIVLADNGDSTEGFESAPGAERTSDLQQTEQIRVYRRMFWRWISELARHTDDLTVLSVPSNHCRVRRGRQALGTALDDWGIEVLAQVSDMAAVNPEAYGHVRFLVPGEHEEHVSIDLHGTSVTFVHGHQSGSPKKATDWVKRMGRHSVGLSDLVVLGHFHRLSLETFGDNQTLIICTALDGGSTWYTSQSGERSEAGVTTFVVDEGGWRDLYVAR